jgi:hypothetical protein
MAAYIISNNGSYGSLFPLVVWKEIDIIDGIMTVIAHIP